MSYAESLRLVGHHKFSCNKRKASANWAEAFSVKKLSNYHII
jgi:hypothetical protein